MTFLTAFLITGIFAPLVLLIVIGLYEGRNLVKFFLKRNKL